MIKAARNAPSARPGTNPAAKEAPLKLGPELAAFGLLGVVLSADAVVDVGLADVAVLLGAEDEVVGAGEALAAITHRLLSQL